jgi:hypothetical protein
MTAIQIHIWLYTGSRMKLKEGRPPLIKIIYTISDYYYS